MRILLLLLALPGMALAQIAAPGARPTPKPSTLMAIEAFAVKPPDEGSPFFSDRNAAKSALAQSPSQRDGEVAVYPRVKDSPDSATAILTHFFTDMFSSIHIGPINRGPASQKLDIDPEKFSLQDRREVEAIYTVRNNTKKLVRLEFPTTQRIDLVTKSPSGTVIERWSDDRAFVPKEGLVVINPNERLEYNEKVPTRDMKGGETYTVEAEMLGYPRYDATKSVTPSP